MDPIRENLHIFLRISWRYFAVHLHHHQRKGPGEGPEQQNRSRDLPLLSFSASKSKQKYNFPSQHHQIQLLTWLKINYYQSKIQYQSDSAGITLLFIYY